MINDVFESIGVAVRRLFSNWPALLISVLLYAILLAAVYTFLSIREATWTEVLLTVVVLPLVALVAFFVLQAMGLSYVRIGVGAGYLFKRAWKDCWTLIAISLPLLLLGWLSVKLFGYAEQRWVTDAETPKRAAQLVITWGRVIILYFVLPLIAIHLWIVAMREGLHGAFRGFSRGIARAFAPSSVLIYLVVLAAAVALAYLLFFTKTHVAGDWGEWLLAGGRVAAGLLVLLIGWLITLGAMAELTARRALRATEA